jgi:hypothetical protein
VKAVQPVPQRPVGFGIQMPIAVQGEAHRRMPGATSDLLGTSSGGDPQGDRTHPTVRSATAPERAEVSQLPAATSWAHRRSISRARLRWRRATHRLTAQTACPRSGSIRTSRAPAGPQDQSSGASALAVPLTHRGPRRRIDRPSWHRPAPVRRFIEAKAAGAVLIGTCHPTSPLIQSPIANAKATKMNTAG